MLDEYPENKLHQIFPELKESRTNRKEESAIFRFRVDHSFIIYSFLLKGEEPPVCIGCDERLTIEHILLTCSDLTETRVKQAFYSSVTVCFISRLRIEKTKLSERNQYF